MTRLLSTSLAIVALATACASSPGGTGTSLAGRDVIDCRATALADGGRFVAPSGARCTREQSSLDAAAPSHHWAVYWDGGGLRFVSPVQGVTYSLTIHTPAGVLASVPGQEPSSVLVVAPTADYNPVTLTGDPQGQPLLVDWTPQ